MQETFKQMCDLESKFFQSLNFWKFLEFSCLVNKEFHLSSDPRDMVAP